MDGINCRTYTYRKESADSAAARTADTVVVGLLDSVAAHRCLLGGVERRDRCASALSLPDPLFEAAERTARRLGISRSELYAKALTTFLKQDEGQHITQSINHVLQGAALCLDPVLAQAQAASLGPDEGALEDWVDLELLSRREAPHG
ncbi:MAG: hypothetical protein HY909_13690 [Deltaproteobacteria bacterium]|nr:hypothetical protein [Deltaproteobacteria bacterium]